MSPEATKSNCLLLLSSSFTLAQIGHRRTLAKASLIRFLPLYRSTKLEDKLQKATFNNNRNRQMNIFLSFRLFGQFAHSDLLILSSPLISLLSHPLTLPLHLCWCVSGHYSNWMFIWPQHSLLFLSLYSEFCLNFIFFFLSPINFD